MCPVGLVTVSYFIYPYFIYPYQIRDSRVRRGHVHTVGKKNQCVILISFLSSSKPDECIFTFVFESYPVFQLKKKESESHSIMSRNSTQKCIENIMTIICDTYLIRYSRYIHVKSSCNASRRSIINHLLNDFVYFCYNMNYLL